MKIWLLLLIVGLAQARIIDTQLELAFVIFRHGERVPETNEQFPTDEYKIDYFYPMTYGELTKEGKRRQYYLGKKLRTKYDEFLGPLYIADEVATFSTNWDRTKSSALLLLAGLFPPHQSQIWDEELKWLPIPVSYDRSEEDHFLQRPDAYCPRYVKELEKVMSSRVAQNVSEKYKEVFDYVSDYSGRDVYDFHEMLRLYQNLHVRKFLNMTLPDWAKNVYPEPMATIASYQCVFENYNRILKRLNGGHILQKFIELSRSKISDSLEPRRRKLYLYSGHENNIVNILSVLGLYNQHVPPYCSAVMLELHQNKENGEYGFRVFYDTDTYAEGSHQLRIPGCGEFCPFEQFVRITKPLVPVNYTAECESKIYLD